MHTDDKYDKEMFCDNKADNVNDQNFTDNNDLAQKYKEV